MKLRLFATLLLTLVVGLNAQLAKYDFKSPLDRVYGVYKVAAKTMDQSRPGWASVWTVDDKEPEFGVFFWPPKYCHAIHICAIPDINIVAGAGKDISDFECESYLKIYPHINRVFERIDPAQPENAFYHYDNNVIFTNKDGNGKFAFKLNSKERQHFGDPIAPGDVKEITWNLGNPKRSLLILTNSRLCQVNRPGGSMFPIFTEVAYAAAERSNWLDWLTYKVPTENHFPVIPVVGGGKKTVDLLPQLKSGKISNKLGDIDQTCVAFTKSPATGIKKPVFENSEYISVASYDIVQPNTQVTDFRLDFELGIENCHWIRIWATDKDFSEYPTAAKMEDTLDLFFDEGFMVLPDSNEALPLSDKYSIDRIKLSVYREDGPVGGAGSDFKMIELSYGSYDENYLFRQQFISEPFGKKTLKLHVIRSPGCITNYELERTFSDSATDPIYNLREVKSCTFSYYGL